MIFLILSIGSIFLTKISIFTPINQLCMNIQGKHYTTIWALKENDFFEVIDQRLLPFEVKTVQLFTIKEVYQAIQDMIVRGAPLIGVTGAFGMWIAVKELLRKNVFNKENLLNAAEMLKSSRPTAVNLAYAINRMTAIIAKDMNIETVEATAYAEASAFRKEEIDNCIKIGEYGSRLIEEISKKKEGETVNILTHCNAGWLACIDYGTATAPIYLAHEKGIKLHVWVDETRPRNQGARLTAFELGEQGVPHTIIADNTGGHLMQHGMVDMVIVGSDRTTITGDVANKIGTYLKALAARDNNLPFYAAMPLSTIDRNMTDGIKEIPIETRSAKEVSMIEGMDEGQLKTVMITPEKSPALNYGFDVTPARLVSGIITEKGIVKAERSSIEPLFNE